MSLYAVAHGYQFCAPPLGGFVVMAGYGYGSRAPVKLAAPLL